jgi:hypothetical protein
MAIVFPIVFWVISLVVLYHIIKSAVANGVFQALISSNALKETIGETVRNALKDYLPSSAASPDSPVKAATQERTLFVPPETPPEKAEPVVPTVLDEDLVQCPVCGAKQRSNRTICFKCAQPFVTNSSQSASNIPWVPPL